MTVPLKVDRPYGRDTLKAEGARQADSRSPACEFPEIGENTVRSTSSKSLQHARLMLGEPRLENLKQLLSLAGEMDAAGTPVLAVDQAAREPALFQSVDDRHHSRALNAEREGEVGLVDTRIVRNDRQHRKLGSRDLVLTESAENVIEYRHLGPTYRVADRTLKV